jgi:hypothetical protein
MLLLLLIPSKGTPVADFVPQRYLAARPHFALAPGGREIAAAGFAQCAKPAKLLVSSNKTSRPAPPMASPLSSGWRSAPGAFRTTVIAAE